MDIARISMQDWALRRLEALANRLGRAPKIAAHLAVGERGEREALYHLRRRGYTIVATRWTTAKLRGDIDLIGWEGDRLCFIEVKSRSRRDAVTAESVIGRDKQQNLRKMARAYLRLFPKTLCDDIAVRFDVVSVYLLSGGVECELYRGAFGW